MYAGCAPVARGFFKVISFLTNFETSFNEIVISRILNKKYKFSYLEILTFEKIIDRQTFNKKKKKRKRLIQFYFKPKMHIISQARNKSGWKIMKQIVPSLKISRYERDGYQRIGILGKYYCFICTK